MAKNIKIVAPPTVEERLARLETRVFGPPPPIPKCADCGGTGVDKVATTDPNNPVACDTCEGDGISRVAVAAPAPGASPAPVPPAAPVAGIDPEQAQAIAQAAAAAAVQQVLAGQGSGTPPASA